jgi:prolipoprotein diacylglyceryltransferase
MAAGGRELIVRGHGLPMNAFPPTRLVSTGVYRWVGDPIYIGFSFAVAGVAVAKGSNAGLWVVTPVVCLAAAALVVGYERPDLLRRFGPMAAAPRRLSLPRAGIQPPTVANRAAVFVWILGSWLLTWLAVQALGPSDDAFGTALPFERTWPVWQWTEVLYVTAYVFVPLTVIVLRTGDALRRFAMSGALATVVVGLCWLTIPVVAQNRPFQPDGVWGLLLAFEQHHSTGVATFPAFHVLWAMLAAAAWDADGRNLARTWPGAIGWTRAALVTVSTLTTGMHTIIDVLAAVLAYFPLRDPSATWRRIRAATERIANSWRDWRIGPIRLINHAIYAALAGAVGFLIAASAIHREQRLAAVWISLCSLAGAGIWAQIVEGSPRLLRPFGWYGGVIGAVVGMSIAASLGTPIVPLLGAFALAAPWIQLIGRVRCLVQGCCHGGPASDGVGIRYRQRRSRVAQIADLSNTPIHATPLYSMAANLVIGMLILRLRMLHVRDVLIIGVYLILSGIARFAEEGYRAEPQTPVICGLHSYQWLAIGSMLVGIWWTTLSMPTVAVGFGPIEQRVAATGLAIGLLAGCAMGVDVPRSNRRFSRLARAD